MLSLFGFLYYLIFPFFGALKSESYPDKLSVEDEVKYLSLHKEGDKYARNKLIEHNLRLVAHIVKKYENVAEEKDDLLSIGIIGLIKAVDTFNHSANNKLATYAARCIENEVLMQLRSNKNRKNLCYLNSAVSTDREGNEISLVDIIRDENESTLDSIIREESIDKLRTALSILNERELDVIERRYGINNRPFETQKEIASKLNISRSYVSRIEKRALMKLYLELLDE